MAERIVGYTRVADPGACAFCQEVDGAFLRSSDPMPLHPGCGCGVEPIVGEIPEDARSHSEIATQGTRAPAEALASRDFSAAGGYTEAEIAAAETYTGSIDSFLINRALRDPRQRMGGKMAQTVDGLDAAIARSGPLGESVRVHRVIVGDVEEIIGDVGSVIDEAGFSSTTGSTAWLDEFLERRPGFLGGGETIRMELRVDPRVRALWGANPDEDELILERGVRYVIDSIERKDDGWMVKATVLPPA